MKPRALIVDDSLTVRMHLAEAFKNSGFIADLCGSLACARERLQASPPDVVILDLHLPDGDGVDLLSQIRATAHSARIGVVLLSARSEVEDRLRGLSIGADEYFAKPYDITQLVSRANELAQRSERHGAATVLVIDDSLTYREELRSLLEEAGYSVLVATTGEEGLQLAFTKRPTAIIVDFKLPGMAGDAVIRRIRQDAGLRRTPALLLTASEDPLDQLRALDAGADTFVRKDQTQEVLLACLNSVVRSASTPSAFEGVSTPGVCHTVFSGNDDQLFASLQGLLAQECTLSRINPGPDFISNLRRESPDCILLEDDDPEGILEAMTQSIKSTPELANARVIVIGDGDDTIAAMNAGADDLISVHSDTQVIAARVRAHLRRKQLEDENRGIREHILRNRVIAETQKELAKAAAAKNQELQQLAETIPALVWTGGRDGKFTYCNSRWYEYTGLSLDQSLGDNWMQVLHPDDRVQAVNEYRRSILTGRPFQAEYRIRGADNEFRWFLGRALPVRAQGVITRWFGTATDIHERLQAEEALRRSEKIAATGRLAASIAHEINNPLEAVVNVLYLLPDMIRNDPTRAIEFVDMAQAEISRVSHITRQTLAFYRESGESVQIDICGLVEEVVRLYGSKAREGVIDLRCDIRTNRRISGYPGEIRQVIGNLVANAIEASPEGETVIVRVRSSFDWRDGRPGVRINVHDSGRGISDKVTAELFKPFVTTKGQKGTGLGLWVSHSIVEKHRGAIRFRTCTRYGRSGTSFSVFLPSSSDFLDEHENEIRELFGAVGRELLEN